ncbi:MAG: nickel transporter [Rhodoplanes sp.]
MLRRILAAAGRGGHRNFGWALLAIGGLAAVLLLLAMAGAFDGAFAQGSPFGMRPSARPAPEVGGMVGWLLAKQAEFYRALSGLIRAAKVDGAAIWGLLGLSFLYGVFHAAGPGHGKAVISSYLLANEETWRRGITLSFASSLLQALVAVLLVGIAAIALNATAKTMNDAVRAIEIVSYGLIALVGARLTWVKGRAFIHSLRDWRARQAGDDPAPLAPIAHDHTHAAHEPAHSHVHGHAHAEHAHAAHAEHAHHGDAGHDHAAHDHSAHAHAHHHHQHATAAMHQHDEQRHESHDHAAHEHDDHCGHSHGPDPEQLAGRGGWQRGLSAIVAVGLRPCSGAILVLVFALAQGLFWAGVASTFVMGLGTAITVATIATFAVGAKSVAKRIAAHRAGGGVLILRSIELAAAVLVLVFGVALLAGYMVTERMI